MHSPAFFFPQMKKIHNPFPAMGNGGYGCFGCSPTNTAGLKLSFWLDGDRVTGEWIPDRLYEGFTGIVHGGIQATLMDEAAIWYVFAVCGTAGVTTGMTIRYLKPLPVTLEKINITASLAEMTKKLATIACAITDTDGKVYARSEVTYYLFPLDVAREKYRYPGVDAFLED
jgi:uncharacterized protein (TIGR00369 family)